MVRLYSIGIYVRKDEFGRYIDVVSAGACTAHSREEATGVALELANKLIESLEWNPILCSKRVEVMLVRMERLLRDDRVAVVNRSFDEDEDTAAAAYCVNH